MPKNKKIVLFMLPLLTQGGGAEKYFINLARNLTERGIQTDILTMNESFFGKFSKLLYLFVFRKWYRNIDISGRETEEAVNKKLGKANWIKSSWKDLGNILREYDIIYSKNELVDLALLKLKKYKKLPPIIVGVHTPLFYPVSKSLIAKLHNYLYSSFFYRFLLNGIACIHLSNKFQKELADKRYKVKSKLVYYPFSSKEIKNSAKVTFFETEFRDKVNIAFVGRLSEQKGIDSLISIIKKISKEKEIADKIAINIFGSGTKFEEDLVKNAAKEFDFVRYFGHIENKYIPNILSKQDLMITTAKWETLPFNVLEAQAMGLPVIAFDIPGPNDIIENNVSGFLVKDEKEFYEKIVWFVSHQADFDREKISQMVDRKFNPDKIYGELLEMFEDNITQNK